MGHRQTAETRCARAYHNIYSRGMFHIAASEVARRLMKVASARRSERASSFKKSPSRYATDFASSRRGEIQYEL